MRPIRFRGWNAVRKTMQTDSQVVLSVLASAQFMKDIEAGIFTPEQFTGSLDRNYREIFEGDIVRIGSHNYVVEWTDNTAQFELRGSGGWLLGMLHANKAEIIGNIHENPELVEA